MASQTVRQQLYKLAAQWPKDAIRPNHQFSDAIAQIAESSAAFSATRSSAGGSAALRQIEDGEAMVKALQRLLNNRAIKQYPLAERTKKPPSMPKHYVYLMDGIRRAERGEREPWWKSLLRIRK